VSIEIEHRWPLCDECRHGWIDHDEDGLCDLRDVCGCYRYWPAGLRTKKENL
jgi:hypothetical protein